MLFCRGRFYLEGSSGALMDASFREASGGVALEFMCGVDSGVGQQA